MRTPHRILSARGSHLFQLAERAGFEVLASGFARLLGLGELCIHMQSCLPRFESTNPTQRVTTRTQCPGCHSGGEGGIRTRAGYPKWFSRNVNYQSDRTHYSKMLEVRRDRKPCGIKVFGLFFCCRSPVSKAHTNFLKSRHFWKNPKIFSRKNIYTIRTQITLSKPVACH